MMAEESSPAGASAPPGDVAVHVPAPEAFPSPAATSDPAAPAAKAAAPANPAAAGSKSIPHEKEAIAADATAATDAAADADDDADADDGTEIGSRINDRRHDPSVAPESVAKLQWTKGHAGIGINTKTFWLDELVPGTSTGERLRLTLRHNSTSSKVSLSVGPELCWEATTPMHVANVVASTAANSGVRNRTFYFGVGVKAILFFENVCKGLLPTPSSYRYGFLVCPSADPSTHYSPKDEANSLSTNTAGKDFKVWIPRADLTGDDVTWYRVDTKRLGTGVEVAVHRRFRDFHFLHQQLGTYFKGSHLYHSLPRPPAKGIKLLQDHSDPGFIEERRVQCEAYVRKLLLFPRVAEIQEMMDFLGLVGAGGKLREMSVIFQAGPLGIKMNRQGMGVSRIGVAAFNNRKSADGASEVPGQAEQSGLINIGDNLVKVAGDDVSGMEYDEAIRLVVAAKRPLVLHFTGYEVRVAGDADGVAGGGEAKS
jgi:hypothetical protein